MGYKVLIVDDSKLARMSVARALGSLYPDWSRVEATGVDEALDTIKASGIDIVLLDFNMPGRDGLSLAIELHEIRPDLPVAIISANHQTEIVNRAKAAGATFLPKPLTDAALAEFLKQAVERLETSAK